MRTRTIALLALVPGVALGVAHSREKPDRFAPAFDPTTIDMEAGASAQQSSMMRSDRHEMLEYFVGKWDIQMKMAEGAMADMPPMPGTTTFEMILDGRFLQGKGTLNYPGLGESETLVILGFDTFANRYDLTLLNALNTTTLRATGLATQGGDSIRFYGPMDEPILNFHARSVRYVWRVVDENTFVIDVDDLAIGDPERERVFSMTYTRHTE